MPTQEELDTFRNEALASIQDRLTDPNIPHDARLIMQTILDAEDPILQNTLMIILLAVDFKKMEHAFSALADLGAALSLLGIMKDILKRS